MPTVVFRSCESLFFRSCESSWEDEEDDYLARAFLTYVKNICPFADRSDDSDSVVLTANFTFVARDSVTGKSAQILAKGMKSQNVSNKFYFTFTVSAESLGQQIRNVVPATEEEARRVIERMDAETER
ncbi:hypothetical protein POM88_016368 [Heracleum sosnowskyi]|uniref:Uncharacterized protein n=1 Tax=Heracleum sosnowskyi TaxID=360622 RepID=A0AAD8IM18_9APIA|nr:hypothetical protein POM88_016368 [Heracleum sosnowskyi]